MRYEEAIDFLYRQLPIFQRLGKAAYRADLGNTIALCEWANHPEKKFKSIHVAGTNGKGSVSHLIAATFQEAGYKVGLYTSPHLKDFRERIRLNGQLIPREFVVQFTERLKVEWDQIALSPSFFEITVIMAFEYFAMESVDVAIIETGMGGRLDSTNVITPELSVITSIGMDHMDFLGDTISAIAREKAGIIKEEVPVVLGKLPEEALEECLKRADSKRSEVFLAEEMKLPLIQSELNGDYQRQNEQTAMAACQVLKQMAWKIDEEVIQSAFQNVTGLTGLRGRWEILNKEPLTIADVAHNYDGIKAVSKQLRRIPAAAYHFVLGMADDKDINKILDLFPKEATYYFCKADVPRGLDDQELQRMARDKGLIGEYYGSVKAAVQAAMLQANKGDVVYIGGSIFVVAEAI